PEGLEGRFEKVKTREQFTALLGDVWPKAAGAPAADELEQAAIAGLFSVVPGSGAFYSPDAVRINDQIAGNRYVGIGIQIRVHDEEKLPQIVTPFRGGPAPNDRPKPGDPI